MVALYAGRRQDGLTSLAFSVFVLTLLNPAALFDLSLLLSAAASLGLLLFSEPVTRWITRRLTVISRWADRSNQPDQALHEPSESRPASAAALAAWLVSLGLATVFAQVMTLPLIGVAGGLEFFKVLLLNILVAPVQPIIITLGLIVVVFVQIVPAIAGIVATVIALPLRYTLLLTREFASSMSADVVTLSESAAVMYYAAIGGFVYLSTLHPDRRANRIAAFRAWWQAHAGSFLLRFKRGSRFQIVIVIGCLAVCAIGAQTLASGHDGSLLLHLLPADEIAVVLIRTPGDTLILLNAGNTPRRIEADIGDVLPYQRTSDLILARLDATLNSALPHVVERYHIPNVIVPLRKDSDTLATYRNPLLDQLRAAPEMQLQPIYTDEHLAEGAVSIVWRYVGEVDFPDIQYHLTGGAFRVLVLPPMRGAEVRSLLQSDHDLSAQILILTLTDSSVSSLEALLERTSPQVVFFVQSPGEESAVAVNSAQSTMNKINAARAIQSNPSTPIQVYNITPAIGYSVRVTTTAITITARG